MFPPPHSPVQFLFLADHVRRDDIFSHWSWLRRGMEWTVSRQSSGIGPTSCSAGLLHGLCDVGPPVLVSVSVAIGVCLCVCLWNIDEPMSVCLASRQAGCNKTQLGAWWWGTGADHNSTHNHIVNGIQCDVGTWRLGNRWRMLDLQARGHWFDS